MNDLRTKHPSAYEELSRGEFAVQRCAGSAFAQVPVDQAIEQSINPDSKVKGGVIGFSLKPSAVQRWVVTAHERAAIAQAGRQLTGMDNTNPNHGESGRSAVDRHETSVDNLLSLLKSWQDPFCDSDNLINIASGVAANDDVQRDLINALEIGESALKKFI